MAGSARRIVVEFIGDGKNLSGELNDLQGKTGKFGSFMKSAGKAAAYGLGAGLVVAGGAAVKFAQAAAEDAQSAELLRGALERNAGATKNQVAAVEDWITAQGKAFGVADDDLRPALSRLVTATHDVGKAQKLAALGMDVSAATGKSLEQVTEALMKAQNGQVAGLSRLGVNIKDAAGETLSFTDITKRMSDQFGGAAAEKADTFQGKMDRLKLMMSETGEAIGYKLLPVLTNLMGWVETTAIPAAEAFFKEWQQGKGTAGQVRDVLEALGATVKKVATFVVHHREVVAALAVAFVAYKAIMVGVAVQQGIALAVLKAHTVGTIQHTVVTKAAAVASAAWTAIQWALNAALTANPIGLIVVAIAALTAGVIIAYKKSETFRNGVNALWGVLKKLIGFTPLGALILNFNQIKAAVDAVVGAVQSLVSWIGKLDLGKLKGAAGVIPGLGFLSRGKGGGNSVDVGNPGAALIESIVKGIGKGKVKLQTALDKLKEYIQKHQDSLADLLSKRQDIVNAFRGMTSNLFGTDLSSEDGSVATIQRLLDAGAARRAKAQTLGSDVQSLLSKGLSKDLLQQMIDAGEAGAEQIHLLASGTQQQIEQANADNDATRKALEDAGLAVGDAIYGAGIAQEQANIKLADTVRDKLAELLDLQDKNTIVELHLDGRVILATLKKIKRQQGGHLGLGDTDKD